MSTICLLIQTTPTVEDGNYLRIGQALLAQGHKVHLCFIDSLRLNTSSVIVRGFDLTAALSQDDPFPAVSDLALDATDLVWIFSVGERISFLDKIQLLYALGTPVVNSIDAIMHLKSKYLLTGNAEIFHSPETHASPVATELINIILADGGKWIVKPPAGSLGRDVFLVDRLDPNMRLIVQHLCGKDDTNYTLLQRYVPEIENGEKRVLIAGGEVIGQYQREAGEDHRTNVSQGAKISACELTPDEHTYCRKLGAHLLAMGAHFVAIDLVFPWLIEVNVVNPGGLVTIDELTGHDHSAAVAERVLGCLHGSLDRSVHDTIHHHK